MASTSIEKRRKIRKLEAQRDTLLQKANSAKLALQGVRVQLKAARKETA